MWVSTTYVLPHKHQSLLNWICGKVILGKSTNVHEYQLSLGTLVEFLNSKCLAEGIRCQSHQITIRQNFIQALFVDLDKEDNPAILQSIQDIGKRLAEAKGILSPLTFQYKTLCQYLAAWIGNVHQALKRVNTESMDDESNSEDCGSLLEQSINHIIMLMNLSQEITRKKSIRNRGVLKSFCEYLLPSILHLHYLYHQSSILEEKNYAKDRLLECIEDTISTALFKKSDIGLYDQTLPDNDIGDQEATIKKSKPKLNQPSKDFDLLMDALKTEYEQKTFSGQALAHNIHLFFRLFLTSFKNCHISIKTEMLKQLLNKACLHETKCQNKTGQCPQLDLEVLNSILQLLLDFRLYHPAVHQQESEKLLILLNEVAKSLLERYEPKPAWFSCVQFLAQIDKSIVEPLMKSLFLKLSTSCQDGVFLASSVSKLIESLVNIYVDVRQPLRLVKLLLLITEQSSKQTVNKTDIEKMGTCMGKFGVFLGKHFSSTISPSVVMDIWSFAGDDLTKMVNEIQNASQPSSPSVTPVIIESAVDRCQILVRFVEKIVSATPLLTIWYNPMVREKLDSCMNSLELSASCLHAVITASQAGSMAKFSSSCIMEIFLSVLLTHVKAKYVLEKYAIKKSQSITPAIPTLLYSHNLAGLRESQSVADFLDTSYISSDCSKLLFLQLVLCRIRGITEDINAIEIFHNSNRTTRDDLIKILEVSKHKVCHLTVELETVLRLVKPQAVGEKRREDHGMFCEVFTIVNNHLPVLLLTKNAGIMDWITDAVLFLISKDSTKSVAMQDELLHFFSHICNHPNDPLALSLLKSTLQTLADAFSSVPIPNNVLKLSANDNKLLAIRELLLESSELMTFEPKKSKVLTKIIKNAATILDSVNLEWLPRDLAADIFGYILVCMRIIEVKIEKSLVSGEGDVRENSSLLETYIKCYSVLTSSRRNSSALRRCMEMGALLPYFARISKFISSSSQELLVAFSFDVVREYYRDAMDSSFAEFVSKEYVKARIQTTEDEKKMETMLAIHIKALVNILIIDDTWRDKSTSLIGEGRKRKFRTELQVAKRLKLSSDDRGGNSLSATILSHLEKLVTEICPVLLEMSTMRDETYYNFLHACTEGSFVLGGQQHCELKNICFLKNQFDDTLVRVEDQHDAPKLTAMLKFISSHAKVHQNFCILEKKHLISLTKCYQKVSSSPTAVCYLNSLLGSTLQNMSRFDLQKDVFAGVLHELVAKEGDDLKNSVEFCHLLLRFLPGNDKCAEQQSWTAICGRFVKSMLDALLNLLEMQFELRNSATQILALKAVVAILKLQWVKLNTSYVCNILCTIHETPLVRLAGSLLDQEDPQLFYCLYKSCCEVVHQIIVNCKELEDIVSLCNAVIRKLLKSGMQLGDLRKYALKNNSLDLPSPVYIQEANKCARLLEKLFQLIADRHKTSFAKCVSHVVADFICIITASTFVPAVKKCFTVAVNHLLSVVDEYGVAMIRNALPAGVRDTFQLFYLDYCKYFKYKGRV